MSHLPGACAGKCFLHLLKAIFVLMLLVDLVIDTCRLLSKMFMKHRSKEKEGIRRKELYEREWKD